jgi:hypothetical protein
VSKGGAARLSALKAGGEQRRLSKEELLKPRIAEEDVFIAGLGGTVRLRSISHRARQEIRTASGFGTAEWDEDKMTMLSIVHSVIDPKITEEDLTAFADQDATVVDELIMRIGLLNMLGQVDELGKESRRTESSDSPSN